MVPPLPHAGNINTTPIAATDQEKPSEGWEEEGVGEVNHPHPPGLGDSHGVWTTSNNHLSTTPIITQIYTKLVIKGSIGEKNGFSIEGCRTCKWKINMASHVKGKRKYGSTNDGVYQGDIYLTIRQDLRH